MTGRVILAALLVAGLMGLMGGAVPAGAASSPTPQARPAPPPPPAPCRVENAVKAIQARRKMAARLGKYQRRLLRCYEKLDQVRNQITFRDVLGGLGWIFGLCGLGLAVGVLWRDYQRRNRG